jgi:hypothetical protein
MPGFGNLHGFIGSWKMLSMPPDRALGLVDTGFQHYRHILYWAIRNTSKKWTMPIQQWGMALNQCTIFFGNERVPLL